MSQPGPGLFTEHELPEYIYKYTDLKLDKEAFLKPTKNVVVEIYARFLDKIAKNWRKPDTPLMAQMIAWLRFILSRYQVGFEFSFTDLTNPTRKRNTILLNAILLFQIEYDECSTKFKECEARLAKEQEEVQLINREISERREKLEELAFERGQLPDAAELKELIQAKQRALEVKKKGCSKLTEELAEVKANIAKLQQEEQVKLVELQQIGQRIERERRRQENKDEEERLRGKISDLRRELDRLKISSSYKLKEAQTTAQKTEERKKQVIQKIKDRQILHKTRMEAYRKEYTELDNHLRAYTDEVREIVRQSDTMTGAFKKQFEDSKAKIAKSKLRTAEYKRKLNELTGLEKNSVTTDNSKDRTFIKSSQEKKD